MDIRVLVADDHQVVRHGLRLFLDVQEGIAVVGEAADGAEAVERARDSMPDVVLMDLVMPGVDGVEATRLVHEACPAARVLVLSSFSDEERVIGALRAGADGYLTKDAGPERLAEAIRAIHRGEPVFCPDVLRRLTEHVVAERGRPEGTVTILFTDVESSTAIVEELGDERAQEVFGEHDAVLRDFGGLQWALFWGDRPAMDTVASLIMHNLFGRFPNVRVCLSEQGTVWLPYLLRKLDATYFLGRGARFGKLDRRPSEIFRDHFVVAPFPEENVARVVKEVGIEPIVFGSDFPHAEGLAFPSEYVAAQLGGLAQDQVLAIMRDNLAGFLGISV